MTDPTRKREIVLIQLAKSFFAKRDGLTDEDYRAGLMMVTGQFTAFSWWLLQSFPVLAVIG